LRCFCFFKVNKLTFVSIVYILNALAYKVNCIFHDNVVVNISLCDVKKNNETNVLDARISEEEFKQKAESSYQQITDLINRYQVIDAAIVTSNANTMIETSYGTMSVAAAISMRNRL
jgi:hypothetical protein